MSSLVSSLAQRLCHFYDLFWPSADPVVLRQVYPADDPGRVHQKLGRPRDVLALTAGAGVHQVIATNHLGLWVGQKRVGVSSLLGQVARLFRTVYADRNGLNPNLFKPCQIILNAP